MTPTPCPENGYVPDPVGCVTYPPIAPPPDLVETGLSIAQTNFVIGCLIFAGVCFALAMVGLYIQYTRTARPTTEGE